jgi:hypothetical protein
MAAWPSGKAEDCKSFIPSSNLGAAFFVRINKGNGKFELGIHPTRSGRPDLWRSSDLVDRQRLLEAGIGQTSERGRIPQVPGEDLGEGAANALGRQWMHRYENSSNNAGTA